jgi:hypothetical protein
VNAASFEPARREPAAGLGIKIYRAGATPAQTRAPVPGIVATEGGGSFNPSLLLGGGMAWLGTASLEGGSA